MRKPGTSRRPVSVRLSVRHTPSKQLKISWNFFLSLVAQSFKFFGSIRRSSHNFNGNPLSKALNMWVVGDSQFVANISYISETVQDDPMFTMDHDH